MRSSSRLLIAALCGLAGTALFAGDAAAQGGLAIPPSAWLQQTQPALREGRRPRSEWISAPTSRNDPRPTQPRIAHGSPGTWEHNPHNVNYIRKLIRAREPGKAEPESPLLTRPRARARGSMNLMQKSAAPGDASAWIGQGITEQHLRGKSSFVQTELGGSTSQLTTTLGDITGGGAPRLGIWNLDDDRKKKRLREEHDPFDVTEEQRQIDAAKNFRSITDLFEPF